MKPKVFEWISALTDDINEIGNLDIIYLSQRDINVVNLLAKGVSANEIAILCNTNSKTIYSSRYSIIRKFQCKSTLDFSRLTLTKFFKVWLMSVS